MYRMRYHGFTPAKVNYLNASDIDLAVAQLHPNDWHVRMARLVLAERAAADAIDDIAVERLIEIATLISGLSTSTMKSWNLDG